jgi:membrane fusion protein (multidrug efflux system)
MAKAALAQARLNLEHTQVKAAVDGIVSRRTVEVGQVVQAGQPLLAVVPLDEVWVVANYKESQLRNIRPGQAATVAVDAYGGKEYRGKVESIAAATGARFSILPPENASGNYVKVVQRVPVKIVLDASQDPDHLLRPGMSVVPTIFTR